MAWKDIFVHVDDLPACGERLTFAAKLANAEQAHLTGLYQTGEIDPRLYLEPAVGARNLDKINQIIQEAEAKAETGFRQALAPFKIESTWYNVPGRFPTSLVSQGAYADLVVVGQAAPGESNAIAEAFVLASGRPTLVVPHIGVRAEQLSRIMIAWTETREATRAVHDALPLLCNASAVDVFCASHNQDELDLARASSERLCEHLGRHGVSAEAHHQIYDDIEIADALLSRAFDLQADALVMGAYGHSKLRELVLGGATKGLLEHMTIPVLMTH